MKFRLLLVLLGVLLLGGCLNTVFRPKSIPAPPPPPAPTFEDGFRSTGRAESGVPILNKVPFINRFFINVAYGRGDFFWEPQPPLFPCSAAVSEDGTWLLVGVDQGGAISIFNLQDAKNHTVNLVPSRNDGCFTGIREEPSEISFTTTSMSRGSGSQATWLAMLPDNSSFLAYRIRDNSLETMELFDRETGMLLRAFAIGPGFQTATLCPGGELLYCVGQASLEVWSVQTGVKVASVPLQDDISALRCSPNGPWLFLATRTGQIRVFDRDTLLETASIPAGSEPLLIDISPDGGTLLIACSEKNPTIRLYETGTWRVLGEITPEYPHEYGFQNIRFTRDESRLIGRGAMRSEMSVLTTVETFLAEYDLNRPGGTWEKLEYATLPLHPEGRFLLDGRAGSGKDLSPFSEQIVVEHNAKK